MSETPRYSREEIEAAQETIDTAFRRIFRIPHALREAAILAGFARAREDFMAHRGIPMPSFDEVEMQKVYAQQIFQSGAQICLTFGKNAAPIFKREGGAPCHYWTFTTIGLQLLRQWEMKTSDAKPTTGLPDESEEGDDDYDPPRSAYE
jgi:hypothetical protein